MLTAIRTLSFALTLGLAHAAPIGGDHWVGDFDAAVKTARTENKDLLVDFTGSDWCGWCIRLKSEVFDHEVFTDAVTKDFVLVSLDFPRYPDAQAKVPNPKRNNELQQKYKISGYPTVLLMTVDGDVYAQTGYRAGGPAQYVEHLKKLRENGRGAASALSAYEKAADADKDAAWEKVATALESAGDRAAIYEKLVPIVRSALTYDADNKKGHKRRAVGALLGYGESGRELIDAAHELDPKNEHGVLERAVLVEYKTAASNEDAAKSLASFERMLEGGGVKNSKVAFELYAMSAMIASQVSNDPAKAKTFAKKALEIGSDNKQFVDFCTKLANS